MRPFVAGFAPLGAAGSTEMPNLEQSVLLVEEDRAVRDWLMDALSREGFSVATAASGAAALEKLGRSEFAIVLADLPLCDDAEGSSLLKLGRAQRSALKFLLIYSGNRLDLGDPDRDAVIAKPFRLNELLGCVWELFFRHVPAAAGVGQVVAFDAATPPCQPTQLGTGGSPAALLIAARRRGAGAMLRARARGRSPAPRRRATG